MPVACNNHCMKMFNGCTLSNNHFAAMKTNHTISEIVKSDYRAAGVLEHFGIDFFSAGSMTIPEVCTSQHIDRKAIEQALDDLNTHPGHQDPHWNYAEWDTRFLVDFIVHAHHNYIRETVPELLRLGIRVAGESGRPGAAHRLRMLSQDLMDDITRHLDLEEEVIFPYIVDLETALRENRAFVAPRFGRVESPIGEVERMHSRALELLQEIRTQSGHYEIPENATPDRKAWLALLKEFDADLHLHLHLENNILFPRAIALEAELLNRKGFTTIWFG